MSEIRKTDDGGRRTEVLNPQVVVDTMPWKCADCGHKWSDRKDGKGVHKRGCPSCGSGQIFDCNVVAVGAALKPCPFCGEGADVSVDQPGGLEWWVRCAECGGASDIFDSRAEAVEAWNRRTADERTEFGQIIERLKQRDVITQADVDRLGEESRGGSESAEEVGRG